ncbi:MAG: hypothetical protein M3355_08710 [Actinomycetota bacterium]|nr:hypothetical protein [Actinomycetota bacterium]
MLSDISPKVLKPFLVLVGIGAPFTVLGVVLKDRRLLQIGPAVLGAGLVAGAIGFAANDPQREPYLEPGFEEPDPELAEHRVIAESNSAPAT